MKKFPLTKIDARDHDVKSLTLAGALLSLLGAPVVAWSSSPTLKGDTYAATADSTGVYGASTTILVSSQNTGYLQYGLGLSLPTGVSSLDIDKATLKIFVPSVSTAGTLTIRKVTSAWSEATLSAATAPSLDMVTPPVTIFNRKSFCGQVCPV